MFCLQGRTLLAVKAVLITSLSLAYWNTTSADGDIENDIGCHDHWNLSWTVSDGLEMWLIIP